MVETHAEKLMWKLMIVKAQLLNSRLKWRFDANLELYLLIKNAYQHLRSIFISKHKMLK